MTEPVKPHFRLLTLLIVPALALVSTGEAPLGIVYASDAVADPSVTVLSRFPEGSHPAIVYPLALLSMAGFIVLAPPTTSLNSELLGVIRADWVGIALCLLALGGECLRQCLPRAG